MRRPNVLLVLQTPRTIDLGVLKRMHRQALANYKVKLNIDMRGFNFLREIACAW